MFALSAKSTRAGEHAVGVAEREPGFDLDIRERHRHRDTAVHRGNAVTATDIRIGRLQRRGKTAPAGEFRGARHVARWVRSVGTSAYIARDPFVGLDVVIGDNVVIDRGAVTCTRAMIGDGARIGRDARVGLDGVVAPGTTVGRGAVVAGTGSSSICEAIMTDAMYELPSDASTKQFTVTREFVEEKLENTKISKLKAA